MAFLKSITLCLLVLLCGEGITRSIDYDPSIFAIVSGTFYALESSTGTTQRRLTRRHLAGMGASRGYAMTLDMGPVVAALDMELCQDSVWTNESQVVVRRGERLDIIHDAVDSYCFLSGRLTSQDGAVSLNRCGRLVGLIQTGDFHYDIEEVDDGQFDSEFSRVKVTMRRSDDIPSGYESLLGDSQEVPKEQELLDSVTKRQQGPATVEVAAYLDANFISWQKRNAGRATTASLTTFIVNKWNVMRSVYGNVAALGIQITLQLKKIELWHVNPYFYSKLGSRNQSTVYLNAFCQNTPSSPNYDHKMLYTQGIGEHHMGMAHLNGVCRRVTKCSFVKSKTSAVKIELHELGHNLGLPHDPDLRPCSDPRGDGGFMGWSENYTILDCYGRRLRQTLRQRGAGCLYETNAYLPVLNGQ